MPIEIALACEGLSREASLPSALRNAYHQRASGVFADLGLDPASVVPLSRSQVP